jgi:hypothetical protein
MLEIHPAYVFDAKQQPIAVQIPIGQFQQIEAILKATGYLAETVVAAVSQTEEDVAWLESDLAPSLDDDCYDWQEDELPAGQPVKFIPGIGIMVEA